MTEEEIREGDIVEIDYIAEFTKEHISEGKALVIWKDNNQPLVRKLSTKKTIWTCYEHIARVVDHIDIEDYMDKVLSAKEKSEKCIWIKYDYRTIRPKECGGENPYWRIPENMENLKYCPYCGGEIEVQE